MSENYELDLLTFTRCMKTFAVYPKGIQVGCVTLFISELKIKFIARISNNYNSK